jgi:hypothetical protein
MVDQDLQIVKVALAVVAPRPSQDVVQVGVITLLFRHRDRDSKVVYSSANVLQL